MLRQRRRSRQDVSTRALQQGFQVGYQSMDTDTNAYELTKQAFYDDVSQVLHAQGCQARSVRNGTTVPWIRLTDDLVFHLSSSRTLTRANPSQMLPNTTVAGDRSSI